MAVCQISTRESQIGCSHHQQKVSVIIQNADAYQKLLDELAIARSAATIKQVMVEAAAGLDRDAVEVLDELRLAHDIPR